VSSENNDEIYTDPEFALERIQGRCA